MTAVRKAERDDLSALIEIERAVFSSRDAPMAPESIRRLLASASATVLIAHAAGRPIGSAIVLFRKRSNLARLYSIGVKPAARGCGAGAALLAAAERAAARCRAIRLEVREDNARAIALYESRGYRRFARTLDYYPDGAAGLRFEKVLGANAAA